MRPLFWSRFLVPSIKPPKPKNQKRQKNEVPLEKGVFDPPGGTPPDEALSFFCAYRIQRHLGVKNIKTPFCVDLTGVFDEKIANTAKNAMSNLCNRVAQFVHLQHCCDNNLQIQICLLVCCSQTILSGVSPRVHQIFFWEKNSVTRLFSYSAQIFVFFQKIKIFSSRKKQSCFEKKYFLSDSSSSKNIFSSHHSWGSTKKKFCAWIFFLNFVEQNFAVARDFFFCLGKKILGGKFYREAKNFGKEFFFFGQKKSSSESEEFFFF